LRVQNGVADRESIRTIARERARLYTHAARFYRMVEDLHSAQQ